MSFCRQKQAKPNIWLRSQMTQLLRHGFLESTCEQKCLMSHLQVTDQGRSCTFHSGLYKTQNSYSEARRRCGDFSQWVCKHSRVVRWSHWCPFVRRRAAPEVTEDPQMSRWCFAMESQPVSLTVMARPTQNPSNTRPHGGRVWAVQKVFSAPLSCDSKAHTVLSI